MRIGKIIKIAVDILMTAAVFALMGRHLWGDAFHEWLGVFAGALFLAHNILNRKWYATLFKGHYTPRRFLGLCVNALLLAAMIALMFSGIAMSNAAFNLPRIDGMTGFARRLHILGSHWGFLLISLHLGLHWNMVIGMVKKLFKLTKPSKARQAVMSAIALPVAGYGAYVFAKRDFLTYMLLKSEFVFLDYGEPKLLFYLDYLALMGLGVFIAYYASKALTLYSFGYGED